LKKLSILFITISLLPSALLSRELNYQEKAATLTHPKAIKVKDYMEQNIDQRQLSIPEFVSFNILKRSCLPVDGLIKKIQNEDEEYPDQSKLLISLGHLCSEGALGLTALYVDQ
jgi:hypothetical protein